MENRAEPRTGFDWSPKVRLWLERGGEKVLGPGRVELLGLIDEHRSISAAAKHMEMSYRRAWTLVQDVNRAAGEPLVALVTGGAGGGGASLTERGREALAHYRKLLARTAESISLPERGPTKS